jgi:hypothetical protein
MIRSVLWLLIFAAGLLRGALAADVGPAMLQNANKFGPGQTFNSGTIVPSARYDATAFTNGGTPCVWDGAHDDYPCIAAAISAAAAAADAVVSLPAGMIQLSQPLSAPSGMTIAGVGRATVLTQTSGNSSSPYLLSESSVSNVTIRDLVFDGGNQQGTQTNPLTQTFRTTDVHFINVTWQNAAGIGHNGSEDNGLVFLNPIVQHVGNRWKATLASGDRHQGISECCGDLVNYGFDVSVIGGKFADIGLDAVSTTGLTRFVGVGNRFNLANNQVSQMPTATGFAAFYLSQDVNSTIADSVVTGPTGNCIDAPGLRNSSIEGNTLVQCGGAGIGLFQGTDQADFSGSLVAGVLTVNTMISGTVAAGQALGQAAGAATAILPGTYIVSSISGSGNGSTWQTNKLQTVALENLQSGTNQRAVNVSGNTVVDSNIYFITGAPWQGAITIGNGVPDGVTVEGNTLIDQQVSPTMQYGIAIENGNASWAVAPINLTIGINTIVNPAIAQFLARPTFTVSGSSATSPAGSDRVGTFTAGTTGLNTVTITPGGGEIPIPPTGWICRGVDVAIGSVLEQSGGSQTTAVITGPAIAGDTINLTCSSF